jgi:hypothetical protein
METEEELIQGRLTALHPCGARHPLRGFLSKTPTSLRRFLICSGRLTAPASFMGALQQGALEWIASTRYKDEVASEGTQVTGGLLRRRGDQEDGGLEL